MSSYITHVAHEVSDLLQRSNTLEIDGQRVFGMILHWLPDLEERPTTGAKPASPVLCDDCSGHQTDITNPIPKLHSQLFVCTARTVSL